VRVLLHLVPEVGRVGNTYLALRCNALHCVATLCICNLVRCVATCCAAVQRGALCCNALHCGAMWCTVLQRVALRLKSTLSCVAPTLYWIAQLQCVARYCPVLQRWRGRSYWWQADKYLGPAVLMQAYRRGPKQTSTTNKQASQTRNRDPRQRCTVAIHRVQDTRHPPNSRSRSD
jgi:hypothetical protein